MRVVKYMTNRGNERFEIVFDATAAKTPVATILPSIGRNPVALRELAQLLLDEAVRVERENAR